MIRRLPAVVLCAVLPLAAAAGMVAVTPGPAQAAPTTRYVFTAFTNSSESNMYVYTSADARTFTLLKGPAYTPPGTLVRDPSIMKHTDGRYYVVYTTNWEDNKFGVASSADLVNWTFHQHVAVPVSGVLNTWAPEWFKDSDGSVNVIVSISTNGSNFRPYRFRATNAALTTWAAPVALAGFTTNHIDTFIVKAGATYHAFTKQETTKYVEHATATSLNGPYTFVGTGNWSGWGNLLEGQAVVQLDNGSWRIFMDGYTVGQYYYADSANLNTWSAKQTVPGGLSGFIRHGTVLRDGPVDVSTFTSTAVVQHSGQCLDVPNGTATGGTQLRQWGCNGATAQSFQFRPVAGATDTYTVVNTGTGLCLDVNGIATTNGAAVIQWSCNGGTNQQFTLRPFTGLGNARDFQLVARHSNRCVDISNASTAAGALAIQWDCGTGRNQVWRLGGKP